MTDAQCQTYIEDILEPAENFAAENNTRNMRIITPNDLSFKKSTISFQKETFSLKQNSKRNDQALITEKSSP